MLVRIINLETAEVRTVDHDQLVELGMPYGFQTVVSVTVEDWIDRLQRAVNYGE